MPQTRRKSAVKPKRRSRLSEGVHNEFNTDTPSRDTPARRMKSSQKTVLTETVVRRSLAGDTPVTHSTESSLAEHYEPWELKPKTDYTYARSPTYSARYIGQGWEMPNMSRPRIRGGAAISVSSTSSLSMSNASELLSVSQTDRQQVLHSDIRPVQHNDSRRITQTAEESYLNQPSTSQPRSRKVQMSEQEFSDEEIAAITRQLPASVTRSGRRYGLLKLLRLASRGSTRSSVLTCTDRREQGDEDITDLSMADYLRIEKELEYAGQSALKENSRVSLYGLDEADADASDKEVDTSTAVTANHHSTARRSTNIFYALSTTVSTILTSTVLICWWITSGPVRWLVRSSTSSDGVDRHDAPKVSKYRLRSETTTTFEDDIDRSAAVDTSGIVQFSDEDDLADDTDHGLTQFADTEEADSWCWKLMYFVVTASYLIFIAVPTGLAKMLHKTVSCISTYLILPFFDAVKQIHSKFYDVLKFQFLSSDQSETQDISVSSFNKEAAPSTSRQSLHLTTITTTEEESADVNTSVTGQFSEDEDDLVDGRGMNGDVDEADTWCWRLMYFVVAASYLVFIAAPTGLAKSLHKSLSWVSTYLMLPVVDGARSLYARIKVQSSSSTLVSKSTSSAETATTFSSGLYKQTISQPGYVKKFRTGVNHYFSQVYAAVCLVAKSMSGLLLLPITVVSGGGWCNWCWRIGSWFHEVVAKVVLVDVWLLSRVSERRRGSCCCLLPLLLLLFLLPFLLVPASRYFLVTKSEEKSTIGAAAGIDDRTVLAAATFSEAQLRELITKELSAAKSDLELHDSALHKEHLEYIKELESRLDSLQSGVTKLEESHVALLAAVKNCCKNDSVLAGMIFTEVEQRIAAMIAAGGFSTDSNKQEPAEDDMQAADTLGILGGESFDKSSPFVLWLFTQFAKPGEYDEKIAAITDQLNQGLKEQAEASRLAVLAADKAGQDARQATTDASQSSLLAATVQSTQDEQAATVVSLRQRLDEIASTANNAATTAAGLAAVIREASSEKEEVASTKSSKECGCGDQTVVLPDSYKSLTKEQVQLLIQQALGKYGADKTGMVDYALESAGGSVISTRCSETYHRRTAQLSLFGIPLWYTSNSPRTVIQPDMQPGQCWAFRGSQGYIVMQLAGWVRITSFSLEHIPKVLSPSGKIESAPKDFTVWGLQGERDANGVLLGNYTYLDNDEPLQTFLVSDMQTFHIVELRIHSNHGNQEYTCLYRFRVHGYLSSP